MLRYFLQEPSPLKRYILTFLLDAAGYSSLETCDSRAAGLYYGNDSQPGHTIAIPDRSQASLKDALARHPQKGSTFEFDIVTATSQFLTDRYATEKGVYDSHDRLTLASLDPERRRYGQAPFVNRYVLELREALARVLGPGMPLWPHGKRAAIGLSHDVDRLDTGAEVRGTLRSGRYPARACRAMIRNLVRPCDTHAKLRKLMEQERHLGFTSTFFFASRSRYDTGGSQFDVAYSLDRPSVTGDVVFAQQRGFDIALHASYSAYQTAECVVEEKQRLEAATGHVAGGVRHHCWHTGRDVQRTLVLHEQAGFRYDSSLAWNDELGFRRSVALPYRPWHDREEREIRVLEIPVCAMDGNLFYKAGMSADKACGRLTALVEELVACNGVGVVDWHSDSSYFGAAPRYREWGKAYQTFLSYLAHAPDLWVTSLGNIEDWWLRRTALLRDGGRS